MVVKKERGLPIPVETAGKMRFAERDNELPLNDPVWPSDGLEGWDRQADSYVREICITDRDQVIQETLLRFPLAPIAGVQRLQAHHKNFDTSLKMHSYRLLTAPPGSRGSEAPNASDNPPSLQHIFLIHNGLNEVNSLTFHYGLAAQLMAELPGSACIIRPFPGHLSRFPHQGLAELPLDRYLWDGSNLFRQFLRFMVETQWFLSALTRRSMYRCAAGAALVSPGTDPDGESRLDSACLAGAIAESFERLHKASMVAKSEVDDDSADLPDTEHIEDLARQSVDSLRKALGLEDHPRLGPKLAKNDTEPAIHVLGYSLGGFTAQSVFMSWPYAVASCCTLLSGGPLRDLAPTAFAHPEEWQTVLHGLRYELDAAMMDPKRSGVSEKHGTIAGLPPELFHHFKRSFYEVFQQEYRGSYRSRMEAFRRRMLFVVGGDDPIVRPQSVLDSQPPGGINMFEVAEVGHFTTPGQTRDKLDPWIPEIARLVKSIAERASLAVYSHEAREKHWLTTKMLPYRRVQARKFELLSAADQFTIPTNGELAGELFGRCLNDMLARLEEDRNSAMFVLRNEPPAVLLRRKEVLRHAAALYHDDERVVEYCRDIDDRRALMTGRAAQLVIALPWNVSRLMFGKDSERLDHDLSFPSQAEGAVGMFASVDVVDMVASKRAAALEKERSAGFNGFLDTCDDFLKVSQPSIRMYNGNEQPDLADRLVHALLAAAKPHGAADGPRIVPSLPDCWIWCSSEFRGVTKKATSATAMKDFVETSAAIGVTDDELNPRGLDQAWLQAQLQSHEIRIVTVSKARYNPRYRGRLLAEAPSAYRVMVHAALCLHLSEAWGREKMALSLKSDEAGG